MDASPETDHQTLVALGGDQSDWRIDADTIERPPLRDKPPLPGHPLRRRRISTRTAAAVALLALAAAIVPVAWNYLNSYQSTDDAQIDGHIDPLSSRIDGTVIRAYPEDDDRVRKGELLVEVDPRDYQVAVEQARARLELALAQVASARQDYAAALAKVREADAANFRAQRDAQRYATLLDEQVVPVEQYDQFTAAARVDAARVDSARESAQSALNRRPPGRGRRRKSSAGSGLAQSELHQNLCAR
jgi:membrane fusion protein (multidrug efflux system)